MATRRDDTRTMTMLNFRQPDNDETAWPHRTRSRVKAHNVHGGRRPRLLYEDMSATGRLETSAVARARMPQRMVEGCASAAYAADAMC